MNQGGAGLWPAENRLFEPVFFTSALELAMGRNMLDSEGGKLD
eukprot:SAG11_NODE_26316_length_346_cov_14.797571_2_plen_42_part_01